MKMSSSWRLGGLFFCFLVGLSLLIGGCGKSDEGGGAGGPWVKDPDATSEDVRGADAGDARAPDDAGPDGRDAQADEDVRDPQALGRLGVSPTLLEFEDVPVGSQVEKSLTLQNLGAGPLRIRALTLHEEAGGSFDEEQELHVAGSGWDVDGLVLAPGESHQVDVSYQPLDAQADQGAVIIESDDPQRAEFRVPIIARASAAQELQAQMQVPAEVVWAQLTPPDLGPMAPPWPGDWKMVEVKNVGEGALRISDIWVEGSERFYVTIPQPGGAGDQADVENDTLTWPDELAPGGSMKLRVWFQPQDASAQVGQLLLQSNDASAPVRSVTLRGKQEGLRCLKVSPHGVLDFGLRKTSQAILESVTLHNCSASEPLQIHGITHLNVGTPTPFTLISSWIPPIFPELGRWVDPGSSTDFMVNFSPVTEGEFQSTILIQSNDAVTPDYFLELKGKGTDGECPSVRAGGRIQGATSSVPMPRVRAQPGATILLDGSGSSIAGGNIARYEWTLLSKPRRSNEILRGADSAQAELVVDVMGEYQVALQVFSDDGTPNCGPPALVTILAATPDDIRIEVVWQTPGHPQAQAGGGSDVDLHYLHELGTRWDAEPWAVYWNNRNPEWGVLGDSNDDPHLEEESIEGQGPEVLSHSQLQDVQYRVGVFYYNDFGHGPSDVTVRIYVRGVETFVEDKTLLHKEFWEVARIDGGTLAIAEVDTVTQGLP